MCMMFYKRDAHIIEVQSGKFGKNSELNVVLSHLNYKLDVLTLPTKLLVGRFILETLICSGVKYIENITLGIHLLGNLLI